MSPRNFATKAKASSASPISKCQEQYLLPNFTKVQAASPKRNLCRIHAPWQGARVQWKFQFPLHSCSLAGSTSAMKVSNWGGHLHFREVGERRRKGEYKQKKMKQKEQECHISSRFWLGRRLYLLIYGHAYDTPKGQPVWHLPKKVYSSKETLCKCVESALQSFIGDLSNTYFVGNAPMGHIASKLTENNEDLSYFTVMWDIYFQKRYRC
ncbi:39S ribosomal protein L46, mitochondrial [Tanacetum coccineum]